MKPNSQVLTLLLISFNKHLFGTCYALGIIGVTEGGSEKQNTDPALRKLQSKGGYKYDNWQ